MAVAAPIERDTTVGDIMTRDLVALKAQDTLRLADDMMNLSQVRHFPIFDGERLVGVLNQSDLLHASMASLIRHRDEAPRAALGRVVVKDVMKPPDTIGPEVSIHQAAEVVVDRRLECLLIVKAEKLVGLVSRTDLLRALAQR